MKAITSAANPQYRQWLKLATQPRAARELGLTLAEGEHLAQAALDARHPIAAAVLRAGAAPAAERLLERLPAQVPVYRLAAALYDRLGLVEHGIGITLVLAVPSAPRGAVAGDLLYLDGVQEPGNVGALLRVAAAAGVRQVWGGPGAAALWAPKVLRAAQGAHFRLALREQVGAEQVRREFDGVLVAAAAQAAQSLWSAVLPRGPIGWLLGSEGQGLSAPVLAQSDLQVTIPLHAAVESLNVAAAAAVCLFERCRQAQCDTGAGESTA